MFGKQLAKIQRRIMEARIRRKLNKPAVSGLLPIDEETAREPIQNALYATDNFLPEDCTVIADSILQYLDDYGYCICEKK